MQARATRCRTHCALLSACLLAPSLAGAEASTDPWMTDRYEVEIIVFRHLDQSRNTPEQTVPGALIGASPLDIFPVDPRAPAGPNAEPSQPTARPGDPAATPTIGFYLLEIYPSFPAFVTLDATRAKLGRVYARLERLDAYRPIFHRVWMQGARPAAEAAPFPVSATAGDFELSGSVTLYKERYVHLEVNLELAPVLPEAPPSQPEPTAWPAFGDVSAPLDPAVAPTQPARKPAFEMRESRRIRGSDAQYFDHPQFGVIARISEIELAEDDQPR